MSDYYADLDRAKAMGRECAENGIAGGETAPQESPLSGEWAGGVTVDDIIRALGGNPWEVEGFERTDVADYWEDGYNSAPWPPRRLDNCPTCDRRITDFDSDGCELDDAQRWCLDHARQSGAVA